MSPADTARLQVLEAVQRAEPTTLDIEAALEAFFGGFLMRAACGRESWWCLTDEGKEELVRLTSERATSFVKDRNQMDQGKSKETGEYAERNGEYQLVRSFMCDNGELADASPAEAFILGYELGTIDQLLKAGAFCEGQKVHAANRERIEAGLKAYNRIGKLTWMPDDVSEEWMELTVYPPDAVPDPDAT